MEKKIFKKLDGFNEKSDSHLVELSEFEFLETIGVGNNNSF